MLLPKIEKESLIIGKYSTEVLIGVECRLNIELYKVYHNTKSIIKYYITKTIIIYYLNVGCDKKIHSDSLHYDKNIVKKKVHQILNVY